MASEVDIANLALSHLGDAATIAKARTASRNAHYYEQARAFGKLVAGYSAGKTPEEREAFLRRGGYTIRTTLDPKAQNGATETASGGPSSDRSGAAPIRNLPPAR